MSNYFLNFCFFTFSSFGASRIFSTAVVPRRSCFRVIFASSIFLMSMNRLTSRYIGLPVTKFQKKLSDCIIFFPSTFIKIILTLWFILNLDVHNIIRLIFYGWNFIFNLIVMKKVVIPNFISNYLPSVCTIPVASIWSPFSNSSIFSSSLSLVLLTNGMCTSNFQCPSVIDPQLNSGPFPCCFSRCPNLLFMNPCTSKISNKNFFIHLIRIHFQTIFYQWTWVVNWISYLSDIFLISNVDCVGELDFCTKSWFWYCWIQFVKFQKSEIVCIILKKIKVYVVYEFESHHVEHTGTHWLPATATLRIRRGVIF